MLCETCRTKILSQQDERIPELITELCLNKKKYFILLLIEAGLF